MVLFGDVQSQRLFDLLLTRFDALLEEKKQTLFVSHHEPKLCYPKIDEQVGDLVS